MEFSGRVGRVGLQATVTIGVAASGQPHHHPKRNVDAVGGVSGSLHWVNKKPSIHIGGGRGSSKIVVSTVLCGVLWRCGMFVFS